MSHLPRMAFIVGLAVLLGSVAQAQAESIRALYITGGGWHDYPTQEGILTEGLGERVNIDWTIENEAGDRADFWYDRYDQDGWSEEFDVVVYNFCITDIPEVERVESVVEEHVESGVPAVWIHCAIHSFRADTTKWFEFGGMRSHRHQSHQPFLVEALEPDHPVLAGFPEDGWQTPAGELYEIVEQYDNAKPLAHAYGEDSGEHHVNIWTNEYEGVRIFATTIGHHNETMREPVYLDFVARGLLWSVEQINDDGTPAEGFAASDRLASGSDGGWKTLFNGENLDGWRPSEENPDSFSVEDGKLVADGPRGHLFYDGDVEDADFDDFHFRAEVFTYPQANSGIFFHTAYQESGWPGVGYEAQVNATHGDAIKTGSIYAVSNVMDNAPHEDEQWFTYEIIVRGDRIVTKVDGEKTMDYTEDPDDIQGDRRLSSGTFAIQAHDPNSRMYFRNIQVKPLD